MYGEVSTLFARKFAFGKIRRAVFHARAFFSLPEGIPPPPAATLWSNWWNGLNFWKEASWSTPASHQSAPFYPRAATSSDAITFKRYHYQPKKTPINRPFPSPIISLRPTFWLWRKGLILNWKFFNKFFFPYKNCKNASHVAIEKLKSPQQDPFIFIYIYKKEQNWKVSGRILSSNYHRGTSRSDSKTRIRLLSFFIYIKSSIVSVAFIE